MSAVALGLRGRAHRRDLWVRNQGVTGLPHLSSRDPYVSTQDLSTLGIGCSHLLVFCWSEVLPAPATSSQPFFVSSIFVHLLGIYLLNIFLDVFWIVGFELIKSLPDCQTH